MSAPINKADCLHDDDNDRTVELDMRRYAFATEREGMLGNDDTVELELSAAQTHDLLSAQVPGKSQLPIKRHRADEDTALPPVKNKP